MKRAIKVIFLLACALALGFLLYYTIRNRAENQQASIPVARKLATVQTGTGSDQSGASIPKAPDARVPPEPDEVVLDAVDINLDSSEDLEQVIVVKSAQVLESKISIVIAAFQPTTGTYYRLWKGETLASKPNAFVIQPRDLFGNGEIELLCYGLDAQNRQTLTIFARNRSPGPAYTTIFSEAGENVVVNESNLENAPPSGPALKSTAKYPEIYVYVPALNAQSPFDQNRLVYRWDSRYRKYLKMGEEFVPGAKLENPAVAKALTGSAVDFENFLGGVWTKTSADGNGETSIYFDPTSRNILLFSPSIQEEWDWESSSSSPSSMGILASAHDSTTPQLLRLFDVRLVGQDQIQVRVIDQQSLRFQGEDQWNGSYDKKQGQAPAPDSRFQSGLRLPGSVSPAQAETSPPKGNLFVRIEDLNGFYRAEDGTTLKIVQNTFAMNLKNTKIKGYAQIFTFDSTSVLDLSVIDKADVQSGRRTYILSIQAMRSGRPYQIGLNPARVEKDHVEPLFVPSIFLTRKDK